MSTYKCAFFLAILIGVNAFNVSASYAGMGVNPSSLNFGAVNVGTTSTPGVVTVTNYGRHQVSILQASSNSPEFVLVSSALPVALASGQSMSFQVVFQPDSASSFSGSLSFVPSRGGAFTVLVSGTGIAPPSSPPQTYLLSTSTNSLSFGNVLVGSTGGAQTVALTNSGNSAVSVSQVNVTGAGFSVSGISLPLSLAAGQNASLSVGFAPTAAGSVAGSVSVVSNATNSPATITLSGAGVQPQISVLPANTINFGSVTVGVTNTQTMTLSNPGSANLTVSQATLNGAAFALSGLNLPLTIAPSQSSVFTVKFTPTIASSAAATLSLVSNAPSSPISVSLSGTGVAPVLTLSASPASLSFGNVTLGTSSAAQTVTLTNTGNANVSVSQTNVSGAGFSVTGFTPPLTLAAGQSTTFGVIFDPTTSGSLSGSVAVVSNASNSPAISLSGTGVQTVSHSATLSWTGSTSSVMGYYIYRGTQTGGPYAKLNATPVPLTTYTDSSVQAGQTYFYVATAVDSNNVESSYSNETSATIP